VVKPIYLNKRTPVPIEYEAGWNPEPIWLFWRREKNNSEIMEIFCYVGRATRQSVFHSDRAGGSLLATPAHLRWRD